RRQHRQEGTAREQCGAHAYKPPGPARTSGRHRSCRARIVQILLDSSPRTGVPSRGCVRARSCALVIHPGEVFLAALGGAGRPIISVRHLVKAPPNRVLDDRSPCARGSPQLKRRTRTGRIRSAARLQVDPLSPDRKTRPLRVPRATWPADAAMDPESRLKGKESGRPPEHGTRDSPRWHLYRRPSVVSGPVEAGPKAVSPSSATALA